MAWSSHHLTSLYTGPSNHHQLQQQQQPNVIIKEMAAGTKTVSRIRDCLEGWLPAVTSIKMQVENRKENPQINEIVYVKDETLMKNNRWPLARIVKVFPGKDGMVRAVEVISNGNVYKRAVNRLIPLHLEHEIEK